MGDRDPTGAERVSADDDTASVRIVFEGGGSDVPAAPEVGPSPSGPPKGLLGIGLVVVAVVIAAVLFLRPDGDQAADGTERAIPTTTTIPVGDEESGDDLDEEEAEELGATIVPLRIDSAGPLSEIIRTEFGLMGLGEGVPNGDLPLFRSSNGVDWVQVEIAADESFDERGVDRFWFFLTETDTGISVSSQDFAFGGGQSGVSYFTSQDGATWQPNEGFVPTDGETGLFPFGTSDGSVLSLRPAGNQRLAQVLADHTSIDLAGDTACSAASSAGTVVVRTCDNEEFVVTESEIFSDVPAFQVLACMAEVGDGFFPPLEIVSFAEDGSFERLAGLDGGLTDMPLELSSGSFALAERGSAALVIEDVSCRGVINARSARDASVLIVGEDSLARRIPLPDSPDNGSIVPEILGEVFAQSGEGSSLLVVLAGQLWDLDLTTDTWTPVMIDSPRQTTPNDAVFVLSEGSDRVYRIDARLSMFTTFELARSSSGVIMAVERTSPIELVGDVADDFNGGEALYADDDAVFIAGGRSAAVWRIEVPSLGERPASVDEGPAETELSIAIDTAEPGESIDAQPVVAAESLIDVVDIEGGFLALAGVVATENPPVFGSVDGLSWTEIEVSPLNPEAPQPVIWSQLIPTVDGAAAIGFVAADFGSIDGERVQFEVATTRDGVVWEPAEPSAVSRNGDGVASPIAVVDSTTISIEASGGVLLEDILRQDEVIVGNEALASRCGAFSGPIEEFSISQCRDFGIIAEIPAPDSEFELDNNGPAFGRCIVDAASITTPGFTIFGADSASFAFAGTGRSPEFALLADGRVAVVDRGALGISRTCDAAGGFLRRPGGLSLVDLALNEVMTIPAPSELQPILQSSTSVQFLGEVAVDAFRSHLFLTIDGDLWSVDTRNALWTERVSDFVTPAGQSQVVLSDSGRRLYRLDLDRVIAIDVLPGVNGALSFEVANWPRVDDGFLLEDVIGISLLHASDELIFVFDGSSTWRLAAPG